MLPYKSDMSYVSIHMSEPTTESKTKEKQLFSTERKIKLPPFHTFTSFNSNSYEKIGLVHLSKGRRNFLFRSCFSSSDNEKAMLLLNKRTSELFYDAGLFSRS